MHESPLAPEMLALVVVGSKLMMHQRGRAGNGTPESRSSEHHTE